MALGGMILGRDSELAALRDAVTRERVVVLRGGPGIGKSALARALLEAVRADGRRADAVAIPAGASRAEIFEAMAASAGATVRADDARVVFEAVVRTLRETTLLVVDYDGLDGAVLAGVIADLVDALPTCLVVATRVPLERVDTVTVSVGPMSAEAASAFLRARVARRASDRAVDDEALRRLVARAEGVPLVLELLAGLVAELGARPVLDQVERSGLGLEALDAVLDAAWDHLSASDREALIALGVFQGAFAADEAMGLWTRALPGLGDGLAVLSRLRRAGLVEADGERFRLGPVVRDVVRRRAGEGQGDRAREAHAEHLAARTNGAPGGCEDPAELLAAWRWSLSRAPARAALLASALEPWLATEAPTATHRQVLDETLAVVNEGPIGVDLLLARARIEALRGRHAAAVTWFERGRRAAEAAGDPNRVGWAQAFMAYSLRGVGQLEAALASAEAALAIAGASRDARLVAMAEQVIGSVARVSGRRADALAAYGRSRAAAAVAGHQRLEALAEANRGLTLRDGDPAERAEADAAFEAAARVFEAVRDRVLITRASIDRATLAIQRGDVDAAEPRLGVALDVARALDDLDSEREARRGLVFAALARGDGPLARRRQDELELVTRLGDDVAAREDAARLRRRVDAASAEPVALAVSRDGRTVVLGGVPLDFSRRSPVRRVLLALVSARLEAPGRGLSASELQDAGWPGERMAPESATARVYMAVRRLRELGLEAVLITTDAGYHLDPALAVAWLEP